MLPENKKLYSKHHPKTTLKLDGDSGPDFDTARSLAQFKERLANSRFELREERVEGGRRLVKLAQDLSEWYGIDIDIEQRAYYIEIRFSGLGGPYPKDFCREFVRLLEMCDRFDMYSSREKDNSVAFALEYDTHDFYFGEKKFSDVW